ncbi:RNase H domain-containing protein [Trichonephila clavipes]|nr:RNase H domain-containing protein [Trichonephila clavipes]
MIPPLHPWNQSKYPGGSLVRGSSRGDQTALSRFLSGHLMSLTFVDGIKHFEICPKCSSAQASPGHILSCLGLTSLHAEIVEVEIEVVSPSIVPSRNFAELNRTVTCMVLKANDRRTSCPCHDEFRGPRSEYVRQGVSAKMLQTSRRGRGQQDDSKYIGNAGSEMLS